MKPLIRQHYMNTLLLGVLFFSGIISVKAQGVYDRQSDSLALVTLYQSANGVNWTNQTIWLMESNGTCYGVPVSENGVVSINLSSNNLVEFLSDLMSFCLPVCVECQGYDLDRQI